MEGEYRGCRNGCANLGCAVSIFLGVMAIVLIVNHTLHVFEGLALFFIGLTAAIAGVVVAIKFARVRRARAERNSKAGEESP